MYVALPLRINFQAHLLIILIGLTLISLMIATFCATVDVVRSLAYDGRDALTDHVATREQTAVSTALPTIVRDLHGAEFTWVGSAYNLASTAFVPLSGLLHAL